MKRNFLTDLMFLSGIIFFILGCSNPPRIVLSRIEVTQLPAKTEYFTGDLNFDTTGIIVSAFYSDGSKTDVTKDVSYDGFNSEKVLRNQKITVKYKEFTAFFYINIVNSELDKIEISKEPLKKEYIIGEKNLDLTGLSVIAKYTDLSEIDVTDNVQISGFNTAFPVEKQTIIVTYNKKTASFDICIKPIEVAEIQITSEPSKLTYISTEKLDLTGLEVNAKYNDGSERKLLATEYTVSGFDSSKKADAQVITVSCNKKTAFFTVKIREVMNLLFDTEPLKKEYFTGNEIDLKGLNVIATYNDYSMENVTAFVTVSGFNTFKPYEKQTVTLSYGGKSVNYDISIKQGTYTFHDTITVLPQGTDGTGGTSATYVEFGDWPQKVVKNEDIDQLDLWGAGRQTKQCGSMTYTQGTDGFWYYFCPENGFNSKLRYSDGTLVGQGGAENRWFKVMPVKWRVLDSEYVVDGTGGTQKAKLIVSENVIMANIPFYKFGNEKNKRTIDGQTDIFPNNYEFSQIRAYLNGIPYYYDQSSTELEKIDDYLDKGFLQSAFNADAQNLIIETIVENPGPESRPDYTSRATKDKIFLLSKSEVINNSATSGSTADPTRVRQATDFAMANNASQSAYASDSSGCLYWLRTAYIFSGMDSFAMEVLNPGFANTGTKSAVTYMGIVPAMAVSF